MARLRGVRLTRGGKDPIRQVFSAPTARRIANDIAVVHSKYTLVLDMFDLVMGWFSLSGGDGG